VANSQAICTSFKQDVLNGLHAFGTSVVRGGTGADTFKAALYVATGSQGAGTTAYATTNEVSGTNYTAGGTTVTNGVAPTTSGTTAFWTPSASFSWTTVTLSTAFDCVTVYNSTAAGSNAVGVYTFGSQTVTAGNFSLTMPANDATHALIQLA
jgi:hypothetical protein